MEIPVRPRAVLVVRLVLVHHPLLLGRVCALVVPLVPPWPNGGPCHFSHQHQAYVRVLENLHYQGADHFPGVSILSARDVRQGDLGHRMAFRVHAHVGKSASDVSQKRGVEVARFGDPVINETAVRRRTPVSPTCSA